MILFEIIDLYAIPIVKFKNLIKIKYVIHIIGKQINKSE